MTTTSTLSGRDRAILRAVAAGGAELVLGTEPDLFLDGRCCCADCLSSAHDQARFTMGRPNRPAGLTTRTVMISASAIGSFNSLPTPGM